MKKILFMLMMIESLVMAKSYDYLYERNFYKDELIFTRTNWSYGGTGLLETKWYDFLADNVSFAIFDEEGRLNYLRVDDELINVEKRNCPKYNIVDAEKYAQGIEIMMEQNYGTTVSRARMNCLDELYTEPELAINNTIANNHFYFPYVRTVKNGRTWCFNEP